MRFDGVEIKVTLGGNATGPAVQQLDLPTERPWQIWFWEDITHRHFMGIRPPGAGDSSRNVRLGSMACRRCAMRCSQTTVPVGCFDQARGGLSRSSSARA
jgi:hypothetical protein